jgi:hypothetical protein
VIRFRCFVRFAGSREPAPSRPLALVYRACPSISILYIQRAHYSFIGLTSTSAIKRREISISDGQYPLGSRSRSRRLPHAPLPRSEGEARGLMKESAGRSAGRFNQVFLRTIAGRNRVGWLGGGLGQTRQVFKKRFDIFLSTPSRKGEREAERRWVVTLEESRRPLRE